MKKLWNVVKQTIQGPLHLDEILVFFGFSWPRDSSLLDLELQAQNVSGDPILSFSRQCTEGDIRGGPSLLQPARATSPCL